MNKRLISKKAIERECYEHDYEYFDYEDLYDCDWYYDRYNWSYYYDWIESQRRTKIIDWILDEEQSIMNTAKISGL